MTEAFAKYARIDLEKLLDLKSLQTVVRKKGYQVGEGETWEELFHQIYLNEVVPQFSKNRPTIIFDYPVQLAALAAKPKASDPRFVERFEVYIGGIELADCCTELTQVEEQQKRFQKELDLKLNASVTLDLLKMELAKLEYERKLDEAAKNAPHPFDFKHQLKRQFFRKRLD